jgi:hypothetical protein
MITLSGRSRLRAAAQTEPLYIHSAALSSTEPRRRPGSAPDRTEKPAHIVEHDRDLVLGQFVAQSAKLLTLRLMSPIYAGSERSPQAMCHAHRCLGTAPLDR